MQEQRRDYTIEQEEDVIDLLALIRDFFRILVRLWWIPLSLIIVGMVGFLVYTYVGYSPVYECKATVTVETGEEGSSYSFYYSQTTADQISRTFPYVLGSTYFQNVLLEALGEEQLNGTIEAETLESSNMVTLRARSSDAEEARRILEAALEVYPETARFVLGEIRFQMLESPKTPTTPYNQPSRLRTAAMGGAGGAMAGAVILLIMVLLRGTIRTPEDMQKVTSLKCLAAVPEIRVKARQKQKKSRISILDERIAYGYRESLRALQIRLERDLEKQEGKVLLITSTAPGEGKSTLAVNLAESLGSMGKNVLLIDGDLRKQEDARMLGLGRGDGLAQAITEPERSSRGRWIKKSGFWFLGDTAKSQNPAGLLSRDGLGSYLERMKRKMDYIIIDTPPCGKFQDAAMLGEYADSILYVVKYDFLPRQTVMEGLSYLGTVGTHFAGYVLNAYPQSMSGYGYGRYGYGKYGYGHYGTGKYGSERYGYDGAEKEGRNHD